VSAKQAWPRHKRVEKDLLPVAGRKTWELFQNNAFVKQMKHGDFAWRAISTH
jgi:hypothetical protein